jgi:hypothetical protein
MVALPKVIPQRNETRMLLQLHFGTLSAPSTLAANTPPTFRPTREQTKVLCFFLSRKKAPRRDRKKDSSFLKKRSKKLLLVGGRCRRGQAFWIRSWPARYGRNAAGIRMAPSLVW